MAIYLIIFFTGFVFLLLSGVLGALFEGAENALDHGGDGAFDGGDLPNPFSLRSIAAAGVGFGAGGALAQINGVDGNGSLVAAVVGGALVAGVGYWFLVLLVKQQRSTHSKRADLLGMEAVTDTAIGGGNHGQITVLMDGQTITFLARAADGAAVPAGTRVVVESVVGGEVLVRAISNSPLQ